MKIGPEKGKGKKGLKMLKVYNAENEKIHMHLEDRAKLREIETIQYLLELLVLLCSVIMQQYALQCTLHRYSSATLPLPPIQHQKLFGPTMDFVPVP